MKAKTLFLVIIMSVSVHCVYAGSGNAADGLFFVLFLIGFLAIIALILTLIDFFKKNTGLILLKIIHWKNLVFAKIRKTFSSLPFKCVIVKSIA